jgi:hypothetical protein
MKTTQWFKRSDGACFEVEEGSEVHKQILGEGGFEACPAPEIEKRPAAETAQPAAPQKVADAQGDDGNAPHPAPANRRRPGGGQRKVQR